MSREQGPDTSGSNCSVTTLPLYRNMTGMGLGTNEVNHQKDSDNTWDDDDNDNNDNNEHHNNK